jgi:predicted AAA+ superfamily ATPase
MQCHCANEDRNFPNRLFPIGRNDDDFQMADNTLSFSGHFSYVIDEIQRAPQIL